jgi:nicotinate-nucleotide adenylyltransferase
MTRLAIEGEPGFSLSLVDAPRPDHAPNYTLETLLKLRAALPAGGLLFCLMGADSYFGLRDWRRAAEIPFAAPLIVASRPGQEIDGLETALPQGLRMEAAADAGQSAGEVEVRRYVVVNPAGERAPFYLLPGLHEEISASAIRDQIREQTQSQPEQEAAGNLLPGAVTAYIRARGLYGWSR